MPPGSRCLYVWTGGHQSPHAGLYLRVCCWERWAAFGQIHCLFSLVAGYVQRAHTHSCLLTSTRFSPSASLNNPHPCHIQHVKKGMEVTTALCAPVAQSHWGFRAAATPGQTASLAQPARQRQRGRIQPPMMNWTIAIVGVLCAAACNVEQLARATCQSVKLHVLLCRLSCRLPSSRQGGPAAFACCAHMYSVHVVGACVHAGLVHLAVRWARTLAGCMDDALHQVMAHMLQRAEYLQSTCLMFHPVHSPQLLLAAGPVPLQYACQDMTGLLHSRPSHAGLARQAGTHPTSTILIMEQTRGIIAWLARTMSGASCRRPRHPTNAMVRAVHAFLVS